MFLYCWDSSSEWLLIKMAHKNKLNRNTVFWLESVVLRKCVNLTRNILLLGVLVPHIATMQNRGIGSSVSFSKSLFPCMTCLFTLFSMTSFFSSLGVKDLSHWQWNRERGKKGNKNVGLYTTGGGLLLISNSLWLLVERVTISITKEKR